ncbi:hypothetical protein ACIQWR_20590 [Streptomyces sp. NPDC098789]|uniref:hypothetical protein n=1 Tax=Streptomyces sp. NPDC098789 TaxID=3366098 RepID=UPI00381C82BC
MSCIGRLSDRSTDVHHGSGETRTSTSASGIDLAQAYPLPSDQGLLAWTGDPNDAGHVTAQSSGGVAGRVTLVKVQMRKSITWSKLWFGLAGVDSGATLTNCYLGVYNSSGTLVGVTADISTTLMSGATGKSVDLVAPFTAAPGEYYVAMLLNGTWTTNSLTFKATGAGITVNCGLVAAAVAVLEHAHRANHAPQHPRPDAAGHIDHFHWLGLAVVRRVLTHPSSTTPPLSLRAERRRLLRVRTQFSGSA